MEKFSLRNRRAGFQRGVSHARLGWGTPRAAVYVVIPCFPPRCVHTRLFPDVSVFSHASLYLFFSCFVLSKSYYFVVHSVYNCQGVYFLDVALMRDVYVR